jgi:ABC-type uncharacterized transport system ATPase subunit
VSKRYGRREILADVDLQLNAGELLALVGANGSGKSTVLRLMVGLSRPSAGSVQRNADVVSYVPDVFTSHDRLSASAYLRHMGRIRGLSTRTARDRSLELLDRLALSGGADTPMRKLSKGNAQKVALAQALLDPPQLTRPLTRPCANSSPRPRNKAPQSPSPNTPPKSSARPQPASANSITANSLRCAGKPPSPSST